MSPFWVPGSSLKGLIVTKSNMYKEKEFVRKKTVITVLVWLTKPVLGSVEDT